MHPSPTNQTTSNITLTPPITAYNKFIANVEIMCNTNIISNTNITSNTTTPSSYNTTSASSFLHRGIQKQSEEVEAVRASVHGMVEKGLAHLRPGTTSQLYFSSRTDQGM